MSGAIPGGQQQNMSGVNQTGLSVGLPGSPWIDTKTGAPTPVFFQLIYSLLQRTGGTVAPIQPGPGGFPLIGLSAVQSIANEALTDAQSALALAELAALGSEDVNKVQNFGTTIETGGIAFTTLFPDDSGQIILSGFSLSFLVNGDNPVGFILDPSGQLIGVPQS